MDKKGPLNNITDWDEFKTKLVEEYRSIDIFGREVNQIFDLLPYYESVQEVAEDLSPKIKKLQFDLIIIQQFHDVENLHSVALIQHLIQSIIRRIPLEVKANFNERYMKFCNENADNIRPPASFAFIAQFVNELAKNYRFNPDLYGAVHTTLSVGVKPMRPHHRPPGPSNVPPRHPCILCSMKGF